MIRLDVVRGALAGQSVSATDELVLGRSADCDLALPDELVSSEHLRIVFSGERYVACDQRSTNGTVLLRDGERLPLDDANDRQCELREGDVLELGGAVVLVVHVLDDDADTRLVAVRRIAEMVPAVQLVEADASRLRELYEAQKRIGAASDLGDVLSVIAEVALGLVPRATHVTIVLREDDDDGRSAASGAYLPVMTRVRGQEGPAFAIPVTRSVFRKVVSERAAVIAADAPKEVGHSESLIGASIRSTIGVPLWKGEEILGVLQMDNRESAGVFTNGDLELVAVLAHNASLAVANARLVKRLRAAEERLRKENAYLKGREESRRTGGRAPREIISDSAAMRTLSEQIDRVVDTRVTVLIEGETGVGKELIASAIHYRSRRRDKLFVAQNCASLPAELLESELFGHKRGAFTGAHEERKGLFEIADGGTLFLDEVGELPLVLQPKILRALQEGEIRPLGAAQERRVNVRIVAATNRKLEVEVAEGRFREDLYYRLKVFPIRVPPLRERREDVAVLARHFLERYAAEQGKSAAGFAQQTMELLQAYDWPGNVRELQNEVQRIVIQIEPGDFATPELLSPRIRKLTGVVERVKPAKGTLREMMDQVERWLLLESLREHGNNKSASARTLGITREGLHKKLRGFGIG